MLVAFFKGLSLASRIVGRESVQILHLVQVLTQDPTLLVANAHSEYKHFADPQAPKRPI